MSRDLDKEPKEPVADPFRKPKTRATKPVPVAELPPTFTLPKEAKVVNRYKFDVIAIQDGQAYGPIEQLAADESEAIQRVIDDGKLGGLDRARCRFQANCTETSKRKSDWKAAKVARQAEKDAA